MKGFSQENLADMIGISRMAYGDIERNKSSVSEERLNQISSALGVSVEDLQNVGETIANFFDQCNGAAGIVNGDQNNNYDARETQHKLEIALLQIEKMTVELEKAKIEVELWKSKLR